MLEINKMWYDKYKDQRPFNLADVVAETTPSPSGLKSIVEEMSDQFRTSVLLEGLVE